MAAFWRIPVTDSTACAFGETQRGKTVIIKMKDQSVYRWAGREEGRNR